MRTDDLEDLLERCTANDPEAWREFDVRFRPLILASIIKGLGYSQTRAAVEDLTQEVLLKLCADRFAVLRNARRQYPESLPAFIKKVAYSTAIDHLRKTGSLRRSERNTSSLDEVTSELEARRGGSSDVERQLLYRRIDEVLVEVCGETQAKPRAVFWLYYRQGFTAREISSIPAVGLEVKGVESLLARLTAAVRRRMGGRDD